MHNTLTECAGTKERPSSEYQKLYIKDIAEQVVKVALEGATAMFTAGLTSILKEAKSYSDSILGSCEACKIFTKDDNVDNFYSVTRDYKKALSAKRDYQWVIGILSISLLTVTLKLFHIF